MLTKITGIILTKDEGANLAECINTHKNYLDEIIIIDSSEGTEDRQYAFLAAGEKCRYYNVKIGQKGIEGFADLRNCGSQKASNDWLLHIDVDEIFSTGFFRDVDTILKDNGNSAFAFPRINLPFYERYPDHQTRLVNKNHTRWTGEVHETIEFLSDPNNVKNLDMYPIVHMEKKNKLQMNRRWDALKTGRTVLVCVLFRNSEFYIDKFMGCMDKMIDYSTKRKYDIELCFVEGNSTDNTYLKLRQWLRARAGKYRCTFNKLDINTGIDRYERLAIMRNMALKLGLKCHHDYVLAIDSDISFSEDLLHRLVESLERNGASAAAPIVYIENTEIFYDTLAFIKDDESRFDHLYPYHSSLQYNNVIGMNSVGTCILVKAEVINFNDVRDFSVQKCYAEMDGKPFVRFDGDGKSEQIGFCQNIRKKGKIFMDKRIAVYHADLPKYGLSWH